MNENIQRVWQDFCLEKSISVDQAHDAWSFGDSPEMADELLGLVCTGKKTATSSNMDCYTSGEDPFPLIGEYDILLDGKGAPRCVVRIVKQEIYAFHAVPEHIARAEGEGDLSVDYWRKEHHRFFSEDFAQHGKVFDPDTAEVLCQTFVVCKLL